MLLFNPTNSTRVAFSLFILTKMFAISSVKILIAPYSFGKTRLYCATAHGSVNGLGLHVFELKTFHMD